MPDISKIPLAAFKPSQEEILFKVLMLQKLCPEKFLIENPHPLEELNSEEIWELKSKLNDLMPKESVILSLWDYDLHFEDTTFEDTYFDVTLGPEYLALAQSVTLQEDFLNWNIEYNMGYDQADWEEGEFDKWVLEECKNFIKKWRLNIYNKFI